ncbi:hypothetical protein PSTG_05220 [Puccinia striiformis f. sp. tritici PST-78]|uniref:BZIP domain-containing protein n=1 Tax=Puccinia striiformis f. sp. tritici PST-78 TaxID=1165861 RepID=A0A0L0VR07_9BASI|nr:hypothetical protein PSTG_05220 [Puccinia striiformis f. sp. tritici PST-78]
MTQPPGEAVETRDGGRRDRGRESVAESEIPEFEPRGVPPGNDWKYSKRSITTEKMADDWPFLHLNIISPPAINRLGSNEEQELSLLPFDSSHLEAWSNINFQFDEPPVRFDNNNNNQPTNNLDLNCRDTGLLSSSHDKNSKRSIYQSSDELTFQLPSEHGITPFLGHSSVLTEPQQLTYLPQSSNSASLPISDQSIDSLVSNNLQTLVESAPADTLTGKPAAAAHELHPSPQKQDNNSPGGHNNNNSSSGNDDDDANRVAYDEDKRRRNTLASARFRMKKKMKEQEIERTAREMRERVSELEKQVDGLKQENKWLRGLIVDSTASKLVSAQAAQQETGELNQIESNSSGKRVRPALSISPTTTTTDSINVPAHYQKRPRLSSSSTAATTDTQNRTTAF